MIFDTSGINWFQDDLNREPITRKLRAKHWVRITATNLDEVVATKDRQRRMSLLDLCEQLAISGDCLMQYNDIVERTAQYNSRYKKIHFYGRTLTSHRQKYARNSPNDDLWAATKLRKKLVSNRDKGTATS